MDTIWPPDFAATPGAKYIVLVQSMRGAIRSGELAQGYRMPPVRELAWELGITPGTVARAYKMAADEGLVETAVGRGTFVRGGPALAPTISDPLIGPFKTDVLNLRGVGVPDLGQGRIIRRVLGQLGCESLGGYTDYPTSETDLAAREEVVKWIGPDRVGALDADDIVLGLGAQNSVMTVLQTILHGPSPVILTEELTYPGVRHAGRLLRAQLIGLEMDDEGIRPDRLEEALRRHGGQVLLTAAEAHSPTTNKTSLARKQEIAALARHYQVQIIEDDCHCVTRPSEPAYRGICPERAWFVSSLTKVFSGALRFGYAVCARGQGGAARQVAQSSFYGMPQPILDLCAQLLRDGEVERVRQQVERSVLDNVKVGVNILGQWDISWRPDVPFIWLRLPQGWRGSTFMRACEAIGIRIKPADEFALADGHAPNAVRIAVNSNIAKPDLEAALASMSQLLAHPPANVDF